MSIKPRTRVPELTVNTVGDNKPWDVQAQDPEAFTLIVFYRGYHCPVCKKQLSQLNELIPKFEEQGVSVIAISSNDQATAEKTKEEWPVDQVSLGYGLPIDKAREWGLFISAATKEKEPAHFSEPGLFLIRPDGTLYFSSVQTMPFARPDLEEILSSIGFVMKNDYPARGEA